MRVAFVAYQDFNLGAAYVIAYLESIGHEVRLFLNPNPSPSSHRNTPLRAMKRYSPDLVCFSCVTANKDRALRDSKLITSGKVCANILFGGVHPTLRPEDFTNHGDVCIGAGEEHFGGEFKPDSLWPNRGVFLDQLPPVHRAYQIFMTGFGCPFRCSFCNNHQLRRKLIRRSVEGCLAELQHLKTRGLRYVLFDDDVFTLNRNWLISFLTAYKYNISLPFTCFSHAKCITEPAAKLLKESGCECVWLGVQSGHEGTRRYILNRRETNEEIMDACKIIKGAGLKLMIDHIFGIPKDTYEKLCASYNFYKVLKPDVVNCYEMLYFPKAEINKHGHSKALYQKQGGHDYRRYARSFTALPLMVN